VVVAIMEFWGERGSHQKRIGEKQTRRVSEFGISGCCINSQKLENAGDKIFEE